MQIAAGKAKPRGMILHDFSWPKAELEWLGYSIVRMGAALCCFIEPNSGERGWIQRHNDAPHGLRFAVKS